LSGDTVTGWYIVTPEGSFNFEEVLEEAGVEEGLIKKALKKIAGKR
jgi:hypothetical protein